VTKTLTFVEHRLYRIFYPAPEFVIKGQQGTSVLRKHYQKLLLQLEGLQQFASVINLGLKLWRRQGKRQLFRK
jgi:hypothetical protein